MLGKIAERYEGLKAFKVFKVFKGLKAIKVFKAFKDLKVIKVFKVFKVTLVQVFLQLQFNIKFQVVQLLLQQEFGQITSLLQQI